MFAYGLFFDRYNLQEKIDMVVTQEQATQILEDEDSDIKDILGKGITAFCVEQSLRMEFKDVADLVKRAQKGDAIVINDEESLIAIGGTRAEAKAAFVDAYMDELDNE